MSTSPNTYRSPADLRFDRMNCLKAATAVGVFLAGSQLLIGSTTVGTVVVAFVTGFVVGYLIAVVTVRYDRRHPKPIPAWLEGAEGLNVPPQVQAQIHSLHEGRETDDRAPPPQQAA